MSYRVLLFLSIPFITLYGDKLESFPSFQGFEGVVNTPNSEVLKEGEFQFLYSNQVENLSPSSSFEFRDNKKQESFFLRGGFLPNLDFSLRYSHGTNKETDRDYLSDRILNFKYQLPFIPNDIAKIAFGMQDMGGGAQHLASKYLVVSKEFDALRSTLGYASGSNDGSLDGIFGSVEYQPFSWLQIAGEYDTKEWNGVIKSKYSTDIANHKLDLGLMAKSSLEYKKSFFGVYTKYQFNDKPMASILKKSMKRRELISSIEDLKELGLSNISYQLDNDTLFFSYENTLYTYSDMDALGVVLGALAMSNHKASKIIVNIKKSNITQYTLQINKNKYKKFLKTGEYTPNLLSFINISSKDNSPMEYSDRFKPTLTLQPDFILIDGSEYGHMDYTLAMQSELSMRLAKGTILSARYNIPISMSDNFKEHGIFDYRNRNKITSGFDEILLSQFFQLDLPYRWINLIQLGEFNKDLVGASLESQIGDLSGKHAISLKLSSLKDNMANYMDLYLDEYREEKLLSYRYYLDGLNSNVKVTAGEFLYGDRGVAISFKRYFSDVSMELAVSKTSHTFKGDHSVGKFTLSIPFGGRKRFKSKFLDIKGDYLTYNRRKTLSLGEQTNLSQPFHLKEINNNFTLDKYYLNNDRFNPAYINNNLERLRRSYYEEKR